MRQSAIGYEEKIKKLFPQLASQQRERLRLLLSYYGQQLSLHEEVEVVVNGAVEYLELQIKDQRMQFIKVAEVSASSTKRPLALRIMYSTETAKADDELLYSLPDWSVYRPAGRDFTNPTYFDRPLQAAELDRLQAFFREVTEPDGYAIEQYETYFPNDFQLQGRVGLAVWVDGALRGSFVVSQMSVAEALPQSYWQVCNDPRFKPLSAADLRRAVVELVFISSFEYELEATAELMELREAAVFLRRDGEMQSVYLPEIFNLLHFETTEAYRDALVQKAGLTPTDKDAFTAAPVRSYIFDIAAIHTGIGPIVQKAESVAEQNKHHAERFVHQAATWLMRSQEEDGNIPAVVCPKRGVLKQFDPVKLALAGMALQEYADYFADTAATNIASKSLQYLLNLHQTKPTIFTRDIMSRLYLAEFAANAGKIATAEALLEQVEFAQIERAHVIAKLRYAHLAEKYSSLTHYKEAIQTSVEQDFARFNEDNLLLWAGAATMGPQYHADAVLEAILQQQSQSGYWLQSEFVPYPYARGTSKFFEVITAVYPKHATAAENALAWLDSMQYSEENMYHLLPTQKKQLAGALRETYFDRSAAIDASAHAIIGALNIVRTT